MRKDFTVAILAATLIFSPSVDGNAWQSAGHQSPQEVATRVFGPALEGHPNIFPLNAGFAVRLNISDSNELVAVEVVPKYFLQDVVPSWQEPDQRPALTAVEYQDALSRISECRKVGELVGSGGGVVLNSNLWLLDEYTNAFIDRGAMPDQPNTAQVFTVYYIRRVEGLVRKRHQGEEIGGRTRFTLKVDGCWYLAGRSEYAKAQAGRRMALYLAGPVDFLGGCDTGPSK